MKRYIGMTLLAVAAAAAGASCGRDGNAETPPPAGGAPAAVLGASDVALVTRTDLIVGVPVSGTLEPGVDIRIKSPIPELLDAVLVKEGESVQQGQVLARFRTELARAAALSADAQQRIATPSDIDRAVSLGLGYPRGPLAWGDALGPDRVLTVLRELFDFYQDPRYRPSPWLKRRARLGVSLLTPEAP